MCINGFLCFLWTVFLLDGLATVSSSLSSKSPHGPSAVVCTKSTGVQKKEPVSQATKKNGEFQIRKREGDTLNQDIAGAKKVKLTPIEEASVEEEGHKV